MRSLTSKAAKILKILMFLVPAAFLTTILLWFGPHNPIREWLHAQVNWFEFPLELIAIYCGLYALDYEMDVHQKVDDINANVSTRYLPDWPDHGNDLKELLSKVAKGDQLDIHIDTIGYLSFGSPKHFMKILEALNVALARGVTVRILTLNETDAVKANGGEFGKRGVYDFRSKLAASKVKDYMDVHLKLAQQQVEQTPFGQMWTRTPDYKPNEEHVNDFIDLTMFVEDYYCHRLTTNKAIVKVCTNQPGSNKLLFDGPHFWLRRKDNLWKEMIFAYPPTKDGTKGYAFRTQDGHLIEIYAKQFERDFDKAEPLQDGLFPDVRQKTQAKASSAGAGTRRTR